MDIEPKRRKRAEKIPLELYYDPSAQPQQIEIGIDEAGRGPLFGRLYVAAVVLPKDAAVAEEWRAREIRDRKKYTSKKKIAEISKYIQETAFAWNIQYVEAAEIDAINIRQAVLQAMHECIRNCYEKIGSPLPADCFLLVDGNDFKPFTFYDETYEEIKALRHETVEKGDNKYTCIAAASILAKVERDQYIADLCAKNPNLVDHYGIDKNVGYGTKAHMDGIKEYGITEWHRKSYAPCKPKA
jgi:ribonuclease HII